MPRRNTEKDKDRWISVVFIVREAIFKTYHYILKPGYNKKLMSPNWKELIQVKLFTCIVKMTAAIEL